MKKLIIAGLGNPGEEYKNTPHNIGFETLDKIAEILQDSGNIAKERHTREGATYEFNVNGTRVVLLKPLLYMNLSGSAVKKVLKENNADPKKKLWVIHDDVDIEAGTIKVKKGGGSAGHKGIENIAKSVGTNDFWRFRVGIRPKNAPVKRSPEFMSEFVTKKLSGSALAKMRKSAETCAGMVRESVENGIEKTKRTSFTYKNK